MEGPNLEERRRKAQENVALAREHILRQLGVVAALERDGRDSAGSRDQLARFHTLLESHEASLNLIEKMLSEGMSDAI